MDPRDRIILEHAPLIAMPRYGTPPQMPDHGHTYIAAEDGLYLFVQRPWLIVTQQIAVSEIPLPYGKAYHTATYGFTRGELLHYIHQFIGHARAALPNEAAAWCIWNSESGRLEYRLLEPDYSTPSCISYKRPVLQDHESLAIDLHSHGDAPAFWSATDDHDDTGEVKLAVVVGEVNDNKPAIRIRLCLLGLFVDLDSPL